MSRRLLAASLVFVLLGESAPGPRAQTTAPPRQSYQAQVTAVLVDVVVRDKRGRPVTDLAAADFEIREDGVPQKIDSFTLVNRGMGLGITVRQRQPGGTTAVDPTSAPEAPAKAAQETPVLTALVFDELSAEALMLSQRAALDYVPAAGESATQVGVFAADPQIRTLQTYTGDVALVRRAIQRIASSGTTSKDTGAERMQALRERQAELDGRAAGNPVQTNAAGTASLAGSGASSEIGQLEVERRLVEGEMRMLRSFDTLDRDHRGYGTTSALTAVIHTLAFSPGRKNVVFFSQGLPASPAMQAHLQSIIEDANRANITIYAIDASGLRTISPTSDTRKEMAAVVNERLRQTEGAPEPAFEPMMRNMERSEDLLRLDPQGGLAMLSEDTGGFLISDTNNLRAGLQRIDEDSRFHYLLTYSPSNDVFDGRFRTIAVKVGRPGTTVYSRKGYRAVARRDTASAYEAPALALLDADRLPNVFPVWTRGFVFPDPARPGLVPVVVKVGTDALRFDVDAARNTYSAQAAIVVRVKDAKGAVVQKLSQQYLLYGDAKDVEAARQGEILFYREPELAPGLYQLESIVYDGHAGQGSARVSTLTVPPAAPAHLRVSSVFVVNRTEQVPEAKGTNAPLYYGDLLMYPNLGEPLARRHDTELMFYFVAYPAQGRPECRASIELVKNGRPLAEVPLTLEPAAAGGKIAYVGRVPVADLPAGTYELRVNVSDTRERQTSSTYFTMQ